MRDISLTMLIGADRNITIGLVCSDPFFKRLDLHRLSAPPHLRAGQRTLVHPQPMIEASFRVKPYDWLTESSFQPLKVFVCLWKLTSCVAEKVFHLGDLAAHIDRQRGAVLAAGDAHNVSDGLPVG